MQNLQQKKGGFQPPFAPTVIGWLSATVLLRVAVDQCLYLESKVDNDHYTNTNANNRAPEYCISVHSNPLFFNPCVRHSLTQFYEKMLAQTVGNNLLTTAELMNIDCQLFDLI